MKAPRSLLSAPALLALATLLAGAVGGAAPAANAAKLRVVTSLQDFSSIAAAVGGDRVDTFALAKGYLEKAGAGVGVSRIARKHRREFVG